VEAILRCAAKKKGWELTSRACRKDCSWRQLLSRTALLTGDTIKLIPIAVEHVDGLCAVGLDATLWALTTLRITNRDEMRNYVEVALREQQTGRSVTFVTMLRETNQIVGSTRFLSIVPEHRRAEIGGTWIAPPWQRTRVNAEAKYLMLRHAFESRKLLRVEFKTSSLITARERPFCESGRRKKGYSAGIWYSRMAHDATVSISASSRKNGPMCGRGWRHGSARGSKAAASSTR
jgi:hypothetical protein